MSGKTDQGGNRVSFGRQGNRLQIRVPMEPQEAYKAFIAKALQIGRYRHRSDLWSFGIWQREDVVKLIEECYGKEALPQ